MLRVCGSCGALGHRKCPSCGATLETGSRRAAAAAVLLLGLGACNGGGQDTAIALYGVPVTDDDQDGYPVDVDCDDNDADVHPDAVETPGDGVDSNCDGEDDT